MVFQCLVGEEILGQQENKRGTLGAAGHTRHFIATLGSILEAVSPHIVPLFLGAVLPLNYFCAVSPRFPLELAVSPSSKSS